MEQDQISKLVQQAKDGNETAFGELWKEHERQVKSLVSVRLGYGNSAIPDVVQQVSIKAWQNIGQFNGKAKFFTWLYRITDNTCIDHLRREQRLANHISADEATELPGPNRLDKIASSKLEIVEKVLLEMKDVQQEILRQFFSEGYSSEEIATSLGIKRQQVYDTVKEFRRRLKQRLISLEP